MAGVFPFLTIASCYWYFGNSRCCQRQLFVLCSTSCSISHQLGNLLYRMFLEIYIYICSIWSFIICMV